MSWSGRHKNWLPNEATKHRRFCPKTTRKFYFFVIVMVSLEYALFIFVLQLPRCRSRETFRKFLDKRVHASTNIMQPNLSFQPLPYCNSSHELHWGQWQTYIWTRPVATVHHSKTVYAWDLVTMQAITFYSTKRLSWQLFDLILRTWNSSCDKTETLWDFSLQFILAWCLECDTFCMALQGFSVLIS